MFAAPYPPVKSPIFIFSPPDPNLILVGELISPVRIIFPVIDALPLTVKNSVGAVVPIPTF